MKNPEFEQEVAYASIANPLGLRWDRLNETDTTETLVTTGTGTETGPLTTDGSGDWRRYWDCTDTGTVWR